MRSQLSAISKVTVGHFRRNTEQGIGFDACKPVQQLIHGLASSFVHRQGLLHGISVVGVDMGRSGQPSNGGSAFTHLAQVNGWGSAGQCPASDSAKTPAVREQVRHVVATGGMPVSTSACAIERAAVGGGIGR